MHRLPLRHILCPVDLSSLSMNSLAWANAIARAHSAELRAFHVVVTTGITRSARLSTREHDDVMMKLREALTPSIPKIHISERLSDRETLAQRLCSSRDLSLPT